MSWTQIDYLLDHQPKLLKSFHKTSRFEESLRTISEITKRTYSLAMSKLQKILSHFRRQNMILLVEGDETQLICSNLSFSLFISKTQIKNEQ